MILGVVTAVEMWTWAVVISVVAISVVAISVVKPWETVEPSLLGRLVQAVYPPFVCLGGFS